jgi:hypothetical protein
VFLIWTAKMAGVKVAKFVDKGRVLLLTGLVGIEQQLKAHWNGFALLFEGRALRQTEHVSGIRWLDLTGVLGAEFAMVDSNAIPLYILNRFVEFVCHASMMNCEWIGDGLRKLRGVARGSGIANIEDEENRPLGLQDCDGPRAGLNRALVTLPPAFGCGNKPRSGHLGVNQHRIERGVHPESSDEVEQVCIRCPRRKLSRYQEEFVQSLQRFERLGMRWLIVKRNVVVIHGSTPIRRRTAVYLGKASL